MSKLRWIIGALVALGCFGGLVATSAAEELPFVDGVSWGASSINEKKAYVMGLGNLLNVEYAYQERSGKPPTDEQTIVQRMYKHIDLITLNQVVRRIDKWYEAHPDQKKKVVLDVIWVDMVEPNLPKDDK